VISLGALAAGLYSFGGVVWGMHAIGGNSSDPEAMRFFAPWAGDWWKWLAAISVLSPLSCAAVWLVVWLVFRHQDRLSEGVPQ